MNISLIEPLGVSEELIKKLSAPIIERGHSFTYYPEKLNGSITNLYPDGIGVKVDNGEIVFTEIQPEGKGKMKASDYINGVQNKEELLESIFE